jgi:hypothetical protein
MAEVDVHVRSIDGELRVRNSTRVRARAGGESHGSNGGRISELHDGYVVESVWVTTVMVTISTPES